MENKEQSTPVNPMPVGEFIREAYLEPWGMTMNNFAYKCGIDQGTLSRIMSGKMALTPKNALLLEKGTGRSAESWMNLFTNYTVYQERIKK